MYKYKIVGPDALMPPQQKQWGLCSLVSSSSPSDDGTEVTSCHLTRFAVGNTRLLRQKSFKFERLVPVFSTRFVLLIVPVACCSHPSSEEHSSDVHCHHFDEKSSSEYVGKIRLAFNLIREKLPAGFPIHFMEIVSDPFHGHSLVVVDVFNPRNTVDLLHVVDEEIPPRWASTATPPNASQFQRIIAFAYDAPIESCPSDFSEDELLNEQHLLELYYQLPSCMLCCDRLDRTISGLVGPVCDCDAIGVGDKDKPAKSTSDTESSSVCRCYVNSACSVCRKTALQLGLPPPAASPLPSTPSTAERDQTDSSCGFIQCTQCGSDEDSWICLVCGFVGCSRYRESHVQQHCLMEHHDFSMSIYSQQIWDYVGDRFVHRMFILRNAATGQTEKLHFPDAGHGVFDDHVGGLAAGSSPSFGYEAAAKKADEYCVVSKVPVDPKLDSKMQDRCLQYSRLLTSQMTQQRLHFQSRLHELNAAAAGGFGSANFSLSNLKSASDPSSVGEYSKFIASCLKASVPQRMEETERQLLHQIRMLVDARSKNAILADESKRVEAEQQSLKDELRARLMRIANRKELLQSQIRELEESISDAKANLRLMQQVNARGGSAGQMAILGTSSKRSVGNTRRR